MSALVKQKGGLAAIAAVLLPAVGKVTSDDQALLDLHPFDGSPFAAMPKRFLLGSFFVGESVRPIALRASWRRGLWVTAATAGTSQ